MSSAVVADQPVRDGAVRDLDTSIFMRAGAGSGKTTVLVGRLVEAVRTGRAELREIVAITFTEKAAGELRGRVRRDLYGALRSAGGEEAERLRRALFQVDGAHIETIHAFASSLLRERPLEARLDPNFSVLDAVGEQLAFEQAWQDWLWSEHDPAARPRVERCVRLGLALDALRALTHRIAETRDLNPRQTIAEPPPAATVYEEMLSSLRAQVEAAGDKDGSQPRKLIQQLESFAGLAPPALEAAIAQLQIAPPRLGRRGGETRIRQQDAMRVLEEQHRRYADAVRSHALAQLIEVAYRFVIGDAERRRREGTLTFEDLLLRARDLLAESPSALEYFRRRFKFLLIDEFQDTDPLQAEIVLLLAGQDDATDWRLVDITPGRLFIVGDPKQSVYRFRRADIDIYAEVEELFKRRGEEAPHASRVDDLSVNFRSRPDLVAWHNQVFRALIRPDPDFPRAQPDYQALQPHRGDSGLAVIRLLPNTGVQWGRIREAREDEAQAIVRFIQTVVGTDELSVTITDSDSGASRRPRHREICLLVRNRTELEIYSEALEAGGVPYHLDSGRGFFLQQETRDAAALLTALDDPSDEVAVVATLKSAPFSASDLELLEFVQAGGRFRIDPGSIPREYEGPLRDPYALLLRLLQQKARMSLPAFVDHVLRETHLLEIQLARRSAQRAANLHLIVQRAADFASNEVDSLRPFVRWLSTQSRTDLAEAEWPVTEVDEDVVRVLTIHQAKGLEFPIVVLTKMASAPAPDRSIAVVNRESGTIDFQVGRRDARFATPRFAEGQARQQRYEEAEERRLLYVAATRARDYLVLPTFFTDRAVGYHAELEEALPGWMTLDYDVQAPGMANIRVEQLVQTPRPVRPTPRPDVAGTLERWRAAQEQALAAGASTQRFVTPSRIGHDAPKEPRETEPRQRSAEEVDRTVAADDGGSLGSADPGESVLDDAGSGRGRDLGTLIHDALRVADLTDLQLSAWRARNLCGERGRDELADEVVQHLRATLESELFERVRGANQVERELPLVLADPDRVIEGYVDLAFQEEEGWVLVDYKSARRPSAETVEGYEQQVRAYVEAFQGTGAQVGGAYLLFTASGESRRVPLR